MEVYITNDKKGMGRLVTLGMMKNWNFAQARSIQ